MVAVPACCATNDPRLFPLLFSHVLVPEQQQQLLRPAVFWSWHYATVLLNGFWEAPDNPEDWPEDFAPIELSDSQLETLCCASDATLAMLQSCRCFAV